MNNDLLVRVAIASDALMKLGYTHRLYDELTAKLKTVNYYTRTLWEMTRSLYGGSLSRDDFIDKMVNLLEGQLTRAWNAGMRENGLDVIQDMNAEWRFKLTNIITDEFDYVERLADDVLRAAADGVEVAGFRGRVDLWVNRYNEVQNTARVETANYYDLFEWVLGSTKASCTDCQRFAGRRYTAERWLQMGYMPQSRKLECVVWNCLCELVKVEQE